MSRLKEVEVWMEEDVSTKISFPCKWKICWDCEGEGSTYLGFTSSEQPAFTEEDMHREGPEFMDDYMSGAYDKPCPTCRGSGKTLEVIKPAEGAELREAWDKWQEALESLAKSDAIQQAEMAAERAFESRLG